MMYLKCKIKDGWSSSIGLGQLSVSSMSDAMFKDVGRLRIIVADTTNEWSAKQYGSNMVAALQPNMLHIFVYQINNDVNLN